LPGLVGVDSSVIDEDFFETAKVFKSRLNPCIEPACEVLVINGENILGSDSEITEKELVASFQQKQLSQHLQWHI